MSSILNPHPTLRPRDLRLHRYRNPEGWVGAGSCLHLTYNARGALYTLLSALTGRNAMRTILVPAYHCTSVVEAVLQAGYQPRFYRIAPDLTIDYADLLNKAGPDVAAVVVISYFGFPVNLEPLLAAKRQGASWYLIEDWAHSFLGRGNSRLAGGDGEFAIYSFYKLVPCATGGGLRIGSKVRLNLKRCRRPAFFPDGARLMKQLLSELVDNSGIAALRAFADLIGALQRTVQSRVVSSSPVTSGVTGAVDRWSPDLARICLPWFSRLVLGAADLHEIAESRRRNFLIWCGGLADTDDIRRIFDELPDDVCPWAFPVLVTDRSSRDHKWRERGVPLFTFGDVLHPSLYDSDPATTEAASYLANSVLALGVDRGISETQIKGAIATINRGMDGS